MTIPMMITKKISVSDGIGYIIFQLIGAVVAAFSLKAILPELGAKAVSYTHLTLPTILLV